MKKNRACVPRVFYLLIVGAYVANEIASLLIQAMDDRSDDGTKQHQPHEDFAAD